MSSLKNVIVSLFLLSLFFSCDSSRVYEKNKEISDHIWNEQNIIPFEVEIQDTIHSHAFYINVRNAGIYPFSNLYIFFTTNYPNGKTSRDTLECILADNSGKWLGNGSGDIWDNQILFKRGVRFPQAGKYVFNIEQGMRTENLPGIMEVGLRIEKQ